MGISPVLMSGMIQRTDDVGMLKHQQDAKPVAEQQNAQVQVAKKTDEIRHQVNTSQDANKPDTHADAREEGKNKYFFQKKNTKKAEQESEGRVIKKSMTGSGFDGGGFDIKV